jgi:type 1 fimbria pilin
MNRFVSLGILAASAIAMSTIASADDTGSVTFTGTIIGDCTLTNGSRDQTIPLGDGGNNAVLQRTFENAGDISTSKPFSLQLQGCSGLNNVDITFNAGADTATANVDTSYFPVLTAHAARNVAVQIQAVTNNGNTNVQRNTPLVKAVNNAGDDTYNFQAHYIATADDVGLGEATSPVVVTLTIQ